MAPDEATLDRVLKVSLIGFLVLFGPALLLTAAAALYPRALPRIRRLTWGDLYVVE